MLCEWRIVLCLCFPCSYPGDVVWLQFPPVPHTLLLLFLLLFRFLTSIHRCSAIGSYRSCSPCYSTVCIVSPLIFGFCSWPVFWFHWIVPTELVFGGLFLLYRLEVGSIRCPYWVPCPVGSVCSFPAWSITSISCFSLVHRWQFLKTVLGEALLLGTFFAGCVARWQLAEWLAQLPVPRWGSS